MRSDRPMTLTGKVMLVIAVIIAISVMIAVWPHTAREPTIAKLNPNLICQKRGHVEHVDYDAKNRVIGVICKDGFYKSAYIEQVKKAKRK